MTTLELEDNYGYLEVSAHTAAGTPKVKLDLFEANNTYVALSNTHADDSVALGNEWCGYLAEKGLPALSHGAGFRVATEVLKLVGELKKKDLDSDWPVSPASTDSTAPDSTPPSS